MTPALRRALAAFSSLLLGAALASAQSKDAPMAEALFRQGREALKLNDFAAACARFEESQRLDPRAGTLLNLAECEQPQGKLASAWQHLQEALDAMPPDDRRAARAREKKAALEKRVPRLSVTVAPGTSSGARVRVDEVELGPASLGIALPLNVGDHTLALVVPGRRDATVTVTLDEGARRDVELAPGEPIPPPVLVPPAVSSSARVAPLPPPPAPAPQPSPARSSPAAGYVVGGLGVAALAAGGLVGLLVLQPRQSTVSGHCDRASLGCDAEGLDAAHKARPFVYPFYGLLIGGALATGVGAYLVIRRSPDGKAQARFDLSPLPAGAALSLRGGF